MSHLSMTEEQLEAYEQRRRKALAAFFGPREPAQPAETRNYPPQRAKLGTAATPAQAALPGKTAHGKPPPETLTLTLPQPISANVYWRSFMPKGHSRPIVVVSKEALAFKAKVAEIVRKAGIVEPIRGRVRVQVDYYPARPDDWVKRARKDPERWDDTVRAVDVDNAIKVTLDSLKNLAFEDDALAWSLHAERMEPDANGARLVVTVTKMPPRYTPQIAMDLEGPK